MDRRLQALPERFFDEPNDLCWSSGSSVGFCRMRWRRVRQYHQACI